MQEPSRHVASDAFSRCARKPDFPEAFSLSRKLPLPALIGTLLRMRSQSQQSLLDGFFASLNGAPLQRQVSDRAFAKGHDQLHLPALVSLNAWRP